MFDSMSGSAEARRPPAHDRPTSGRPCPDPGRKEPRAWTRSQVTTGPERLWTLRSCPLGSACYAPPPAELFDRRRVSPPMAGAAVELRLVRGTLVRLVLRRGRRSQRKPTAEFSCASTRFLARPRVRKVSPALQQCCLTPLQATTCGARSATPSAMRVRIKARDFSSTIAGSPRSPQGPSAAQPSGYAPALQRSAQTAPRRAAQPFGLPGTSWTTLQARPSRSSTRMVA
jgi:hypothetical protein